MKAGQYHHGHGRNHPFSLTLGKIGHGSKSEVFSGVMQGTDHISSTFRTYVYHLRTDVRFKSKRRSI